MAPVDIVWVIPYNNTMVISSLVIRDNGVPKYVQLRDQITAAIRRGQLPPGARLPTMRQVAVDLSVDLNTVQRAYGDLERDGILTLVQGRGTFVSDVLPPAPAVNVKEFAGLIADQADAHGVALEDLILALKRRLERRS